MDEIENIKRLAGILSEADYGMDPHPGSAADVARNYINGNISDAFAAVSGNIGLFAEVVLILQNRDRNEMNSFLQAAMRRG